jgi:tetratricopeptide (TPR) repeat protein
MAKKPKVTRKQLLKEPDEFLTFSSRLFRFVFEHKYLLFAGLGGLIAVVLIISGLQYYSQKRSKEAFALLEKSRTKYEALLGEKGPQAAYQQVEPDFDQLIGDYSDKTGGKMARILLANICYRGGNADRAILLYHEALEDVNDSFVRNLVFSGLAYAYEEKQDLKAAVEYFERIVASDDKVLKDEALFHLGRLYERMGETQKSITAFRQIVAEHQNSFYRNIVLEKVGQPETDSLQPSSQ